MGCTMGGTRVHALGEKPGEKGEGGRGGSAVSKGSRHSGDSGFDDEELAAQRDVLSRPVLSATGKRERVEEQKLLATLHEEGIIARPIATRAFGVSFEVFTDGGNPGTLKRPPPRLARLEEGQRKKKRKGLTEEQIREKLRRAEQRKKEHEQLRLAKIQALTHKPDSDPSSSSLSGLPPLTRTAGASSAVDPWAYLDPAVIPPKSKEEIAAENREQRLKERLERMQQRKIHAAEVRRRKKEAAAAAGGASQGVATPGGLSGGWGGLEKDEWPPVPQQRSHSATVTRDALARSLAEGVAVTLSASKAGRKTERFDY